jgi:toxin FitB
VSPAAAGYLLDTNYVSELVRILPDTRAVAWIDSVEEASLFLSVITLAEIRKGVDELATGARRTQLDTWLTVELPSRFAERILPVEAAIAGRWGALAAWGKRNGTPLPWADGFLAATALHRNMVLVTRNTKDFTPFGVPVLNPWEG